MTSSHLRAPGVVKCLHQVHSLFGVDRAIDGGISQFVPPQVQGDDLQHAGPLRDNDTGRKDKQPTNRLNSSAACNAPVSLKNLLSCGEQRPSVTYRGKAHA